MKTFESSSFVFNMKMEILIILEMPFLALSTILDLMMLDLASVNYIENLIDNVNRSYIIFLK